MIAAAVLYFGYGSNLHAADFARWCRARQLREACLAPRGPAWMPDTAPVFHYLSRAREGGALDLAPRRGSSVPGVLFEVDASGWETLDRKEGVPGSYERIERVVLTASGEERRVETYVVTPARRQGAHVPPTEEYARLVCEGLRAHGLPDAHVRAAARGLDAPALPSALFVYGTLRAGEVRAPMLARHARGTATPARVEGALLDLGPYPGLVRGAGHVHGELVELTDPEAALAELDDEEGFLGYGVASSLYRRVIVAAETSRGARLHAWAYRYVGAAVGTPIASGDWRAR